ncbi:MAG: 50S ribosomal protein L23 [Candidatus Altiarchaeota archaeon]|nr:50S ribosomal protein L23 [Candidatus Altiarchaeota archaeon]
MDPYQIVLYPLMGEKATMIREKENKLSFIVSKDSKKEDIKNAIESLYNVKIIDIKTMITTRGRKKAHVKLDPKYSAEEVASHFGVL